jgi:hypothetical protein
MCNHKHVEYKSDLILYLTHLAFCISSVFIFTNSSLLYFLFFSSLFSPHWFSQTHITLPLSITCVHTCTCAHIHTHTHTSHQKKVLVVTVFPDHTILQLLQPAIQLYHDGMDSQNVM